MSKLKEMANMAFRTAKSLIEDGEEAIPTFMVEHQDGSMDIMLAPWDSETSKVRIFSMLRQLFAEKNVKAYVFVAEVWVRRIKDGDYDGVPASESPDRVDTLMIHAHTRDGESIMMSAEIEHLSNGSRVISQDPEPYGDVEKISGRAYNLLMPEGAPSARN